MTGSSPSTSLHLHQEHLPEFHLHLVPPGHPRRLALICPSHSACLHHLRPRQRLPWHQSFLHSTGHVRQALGNMGTGQRFSINAECSVCSRDRGAQCMNEAVLPGCGDHLDMRGEEGVKAGTQISDLGNRMQGRAFAEMGRIGGGAVRAPSGELGWILSWRRLGDVQVEMSSGHLDRRGWSSEGRSRSETGICVAAA